MEEWWRNEERERRAERMMMMRRRKFIKRKKEVSSKCDRQWMERVRGRERDGYLFTRGNCRNGGVT